ncbi:amino acid ABC transporter permease [Konateibacter massiliensis]|uniref:amino acid ABC transporter permease n=1 Tax=Konateibacter massiliensis TaxID=2002841 RepID=UPI000C145CAC|nr:amino acid ABC transporter permease [Konateibacter massiliensis]
MSNLFDGKLVFTQIPKLLEYLPVTLELTVVALIIGWVVGLLIAIIKMKKIPVLSQLSTLFVSVVRGTPIIVQLYLTYFGIPIALKYFNFYNGTSYNVNAIPPIIFAIVALGLNQSAFDSETIRAAIQSVDKGQVEAAKSMGMTGTQILKRVLLPQAVTVALPSLGNSLIGLIKGTSLAFTCSVVEMTARGKIIAGNNYRYFEAYCALAIIYWLLTIVIEWGFRAIEKKMSVPEDVPQTKAEKQLSMEV